MQLSVESFTCPPRAGCPFHTTAKRYWLPPTSEADPTITITPTTSEHHNDEGLTLILLHSTSFHKETWEPTLIKIFACARQPESPIKLREAWMLDCPNHGEAAAYNQEILKQKEHAETFTCEKYAQAAHSFLTAGVNDGVKVDFHERKLVGIGHSLGANTILLLQHLEPRLVFSSLVIIEPMLSPEGPEHFANLRRRLVATAYERRDVWSSKENARRYFLERMARDWDQRVCNLFVEHGLRTHPASKWSETPYAGVTLACTREQEAAMYRDIEGPTRPVKDLNRACASLPVHIILGGNNKLIPSIVHAALQSNRRYASKRLIDNVGHLIPQKNPDQLGSAIFDTLLLDYGGQKAKL